MAFEPKPKPTSRESADMVTIQISNLPYAGETHKLCQTYIANGFELKEEKFGWVASMGREQFEARAKTNQQKGLDTLKVQAQVDRGEGLTSSVAVERAKQEELEAILGTGAVQI